MRLKFSTYVAVALLAVVAGGTVRATQDTPLIPPDQALHDAIVATNTMAQGQKQPDVVSPILKRTRLTYLDETQELALAAVYFLNFNPAESDAIFKKYLDRNDAIGRAAWIYHEQMLFRAFDKHDEAEKDLAEFYRRFQPVKDDMTYASSMVSNQAGRYRDAGNDTKVVELVLADIAKLDDGLPYRSFRMLGQFFPSFMKAGKAPVARAALAAHVQKLRALVDGAGQVRALRDLFTAPPAHVSGHLHLSWDGLVAADEPAFKQEAWLARQAAAALPLLEASLARMTPALQR